MKILSQLDAWDPLRNKPMQDINVEIRNMLGDRWRPIRQLKIGKRTFNELGPVWTRCNQFRINEAIQSNAHNL